MIKILKYIIATTIGILFIISCNSGGGDNTTNILGCTNPLACNFNALANIDDNTCSYPEESYDCNDECIAEIDECGICNGDGIPDGLCDCDGNTLDCANECGGTSVEDCAGICDSDTSNDTVVDCAGECDGASIYDCIDSDKDGIFDCVQQISEICNCPTGIYDCAGVCDGNLELDCDNICGGSAVLDDCGVCDGNNTNQDCAGECFGDAVVDDCGVCSEGTTGLIFNADQDCAGTCTGNALEDNCGTCDVDPDNDCVEDCDGIWGGLAIEDECGICNGDNSSCSTSNAMSLSLNTNYNDFINNYDQNVSEFMNNMSLLANCDYSKIEVLSIEEIRTTGIIINFRFINTTSAEDYLEQLIVLNEEEISEAINIEVLEISETICDITTEDIDNDTICDSVDDCIGSYDGCGVCEGPGINNLGCCNDDCFESELPSTGISNHMLLPSSLSAVLQNNDIIGVFDLYGNRDNSCFSEPGVVLVGSNTWEGNDMIVNLTESIDHCSIYLGARTAGYIPGNTMEIKIYRPSDNTYYNTNITFSIGSNTFGEGFYQVEDLTLEDPSQ